MGGTYEGRATEIMMYVIAWEALVHAGNFSPCPN